MLEEFPTLHSVKWATPLCAKRLARSTHLLEADEGAEGDAEIVVRSDPLKGRRLNAEVWNIAQSVVEAVGEIGGADYQRQFHDLPLVVELPQFFERAGANCGGAAGDALRVEDGGLILLVKQRAALVELQRLDLFVGDADSLRRSDVRARSILAAV